LRYCETARPRPGCFFFCIASALKLALGFAIKGALLKRANGPAILLGDNFAAGETPEQNSRKPCATPLKWNNARHFARAACEGYSAKRDSKIFVSIITYPHSEMNRLENSPSRLLLEGFVNIFLQHVAFYDSELWPRDSAR
jgi:hypothetical protein